jgi:predicted nucleic acid-binding protein
MRLILNLSKTEYIVTDHELSVVKYGLDEVLRESFAKVNASFLGLRVQSERVEKSAKSKIRDILMSMIKKLPKEKMRDKPKRYPRSVPLVVPRKQ